MINLLCYDNNMKLRDKVLKFFKNGQLHFKNFGALIASLADKLDEDGKNVASCLNKLINDGIIYENGKHSLALSENLGLYVGEVCGNAKGYAFVKPLNFDMEDYFIPARVLTGLGAICFTLFSIVSILESGTSSK